MPEDEAIKVEEAPPIEKRSFVSPDDAKTEKKEPKKEEAKPEQATSEGKKLQVLEPALALTLIYGQMKAAVDELKSLNSVFSKAKAESTNFQNTAPLQPTLAAPKPTEQTPRVKEIITALEPHKDLLIIDTESSTMFVMVKPAQFLGSDNFSKIASTVRAIGGAYVSAGKNSHFEIPKAPPKH